VNDVSILIDGKDFAFWSDVEISLSIDSFATCKFRAPFEAERFEFRDTFRPFTFKPLQVLLQGERLFTGTMVSVDPEESEDSSDVSVEGYALPAVLGDCMMPASALPLEFKNSTLKDIATQICEAFSLLTDVREDTGPPFEKVAFEVDSKPLNVLADLAKQRNLVISNTSLGELLLWKSVTSAKPVANFDVRQGAQRTGYPIPKIKPSYSAQDYFSEVTGFVPARRRKEGSHWTGRNPWLNSRLRPMSFKMDDTEKGDAEGAVKARIGRMFANMMTVDVQDIPSWRDPQGSLFKPNTLVTVTAPNAMIYNPTKFLVREVRFRQSESTETADLKLVLPGAFSGEIPAQLPWNEVRDENDPLTTFEAVIQ